MRAFFRRLRARIKYRHFERDLAQEIEGHRAMAEAELTAAGESAREARWKAARQLGNTTLAREDSRAAWIPMMWQQVAQDVRYAIRGLRREWGFTLTASATLAVGLGVLIGVFTVFNAVFWRPWPVPQPDRLFGVTARPEPQQATAAKPLSEEDVRIARLLSADPNPRLPYAVWERIHSDMASADLAVMFEHSDTFRSTAVGQRSGARLALVSDNFLATVGIPLQAGTLTADYGQPAIAITHGLWLREFGGDPAVVGRTVWVGEHAAVISGVLDRGFAGLPPRVFDGVMLFNQVSEWLPAGVRSDSAEVFGRLRLGHPRLKAAWEIEALANQVAPSLGLPRVSVTTWDTAMASRPGGVKRNVPTLFAMLFAGCGIVTLLACANIGNLQLARGLRRSREVAVRLSLGASRRRLIRQFLTEGAVLSAIGALGGLAIAWTVPRAIMSIDGPSSLNYAPDSVVVGFAVVVAACATLVSGLAPALRVTRVDWRAGTAPRAGRLRSALLATQVALSFALVGSATLLTRGALHAADGAGAGFTHDGLNALILMSPGDATDTKSSRAATKLAVQAALDAIPGVALADAAPWSGRIGSARLSIDEDGSFTTAQTLNVSASGVDVLGIAVIAGRVYGNDPARREAIVSRSLARALFGEGSPLGRTIVDRFDKRKYTITGLIGEVQLSGTASMPALITAQRSSQLPEVIAPAAAEDRVRAVLAAVAPRIRVLSAPLSRGLRTQLKNQFAGASVASGLGMTALLLASLGIFGVFAFIVEERRREIGVRLALGASRSQLRRSIFSATRWPLIGGLAVGALLALGSGVVLRSNLFGLSILDPLSYLAVAAILGAAGLIATFIPLRRALRVDPAITLRAE